MLWWLALELALLITLDEHLDNSEPWDELEDVVNGGEIEITGSGEY